MDLPEIFAQFHHLINLQNVSHKISFILLYFVAKLLVKKIENNFCCSFFVCFFFILFLYKIYLV